MRTNPEIEKIKKMDKTKQQAILKSCAIMRDHALQCIREDDHEISLLESRKGRLSLFMNDISSLMKSRTDALLERKKFDEDMVVKFTQMADAVDDLL